MSNLVVLAKANRLESPLIIIQRSEVTVDIRYNPDPRGIIQLELTGKLLLQRRHSLRQVDSQDEGLTDGLTGEVQHIDLDTDTWTERRLVD